MNRVGTAHEFEAILWTVRDPDTALLKLTLTGTLHYNNCTIRVIQVL